MPHDILGRLSELLPREEDSVFRRYVESHEEALDEVDESIDSAITAHQVNQASGVQLDRIGALFGELGRRRGRTDNEYRQYLRSVVRSFNGRGSVGGLKFAIAAAIGGESENVIIREDFENLEYSIEITGVDTSFLTSAINDLAELADPSAVKLAETILILDSENIVIDETGTTVTNTQNGLGSQTLTLDGNSTLG